MPDAAERAGCDLVSVGLRAASAAAQRRASCTGRSRSPPPPGTVADREAPGSRQAASARHKLALHLLGADRAEEAYEATAEALELLPAEPLTADPGVGAATHARTAVNLDRDEEGRRWAAGGAGRRARRSVWPTRRPTRWPRSRWWRRPRATRTAAQARLAEARDRAAAAGDLAVELRATYNLAGSHYYAGELPRRCAVLDAGRRAGPRRPGSRSARTAWSCGSCR